MSKIEEVIEDPIKPEEVQWMRAFKLDNGIIITCTTNITTTATDIIVIIIFVIIFIIMISS
jgi:hypothetical protein